jgi:hypothetical protein
MAALQSRGCLLAATSDDDPHVMKRIRWSEKDEIRRHTGDWTRPLTAYPAAVASFFGGNGASDHPPVHGFWPEDRDTW